MPQFETLGGGITVEYPVDQDRQPMLPVYTVEAMPGVPVRAGSPLGSFYPRRVDGQPWFRTEDSQADVYAGAKLMAAYAYENDVSAMMYIDRAARPMRTGVDEYWRLAYPDTALPRRYFLNPQLPPASDGIRPDERVADLERGTLAAAQQLVRTRSKLMNHKTQPVMLVDSCLHSGETAFFASRVLQAAGFEAIRTMSFSDDTLPTALAQSKLSVYEQAEYGGHYPFGYDNGLNKQTPTLHTARRHDAHGVTDSIASKHLRQEIRQIVRDYFATENLAAS